MKTLNEVSEIVGMTRRVIQEYEKAGLSTTPTTTNKYGHLLYDDKTIEHLWQIRFYRELGYNKAQIKTAFSDTSYNKHNALTEQITLLEEKKTKLEALIDTAKVLIEMDLSPTILRFGLPGMEDVSYDTVFSLVGTAFNVMQSIEIFEESFIPVLTEEDDAYWFDAIDNIIGYFKKGASFDSDDVQAQVCIIYSITAKELSDSILLFSWNCLNYAPGTENAAALDDIYGVGSSEFLFQSMRHYCTVHEDNPTDRMFTDALLAIEKLGKAKYTTGSEEVQQEVQKIHNFFAGIAVFSQAAHLKFLANISDLFGSKTYRDLIDNGAERGIAWFISRAIQIYCLRYNEAGKGDSHE